MKITIDENDSITVELDNGHVQTFPECWQEDCVKAALQKEKADGWEKRCAELEQELRDTQEKLDKQEDCNERIIAARDELRKQRDALMERIGELEQELLELRDRLAVNAKICDMRETVDGEQKKLIENLRERIQEQDVTIALYDDENRELKERLSKCGEKPFPVSMNYWAERIHENAVAHGWWEDGDRPFPEIIALCHSELSEALEEYRNEKPMEYQIKVIGISPYGKPAVDIETDPAQFKEKKKTEGIAVEMIDCIIRILDWCGKEGIDVDAVLRRKHEYNKSRPYRHGGKKA